MAHPAHVSLPKPFESGNVHEWFVRFDICSYTNKWGDDTKAVKLPTLLEGEALAAWLEISTEAKETYAKTKKELLTALSSTSFNILEKFRQRKMFPGEALPVFLHDIKQLLEQAMPGLDAKAKEQLLLHQFVAGLPPAISKPLRAAGNTTDLRSTVERAKLLNAQENKQQTAGKLSKSARIQRPVSGKLQRGACRGQQTPCTPVSPIEAAFVASIKSTSVVNGLVGGIMVEVMLDSGSSVSLVRHDIAKRLMGTTSSGDVPKIRLISAGGEEITIVNHIKASVEIRGIDKVREHTFIVVEQLISQVILGVDFLQQQYLVLDFTTSPVSVTTSRNNYERPAAPEPPLPEPEALQAIRKAERVRKEKVCIVTSLEDTAAEEVDEYAIPAYNAVADVEFPGHVKPCLEGTIRQARDLFAKIPGLTKLACHQIDTLGPPARVPPRRIPAHFQQEVQEQINDMLKKGIIVESISSWLAPAVYTRKKTGEIRLCVDYREVNKRTRKDAYPLPLINEVQDRLAGATIFSKLDLQCGYWQIPVDPKDQEKTAFSPGPGMGLFQFTRMPFGLCGAPSTFQRLMDLQTFQRLREAGLTLRGSKCEIGMNQVTYLGHTFAREGMAPDGSKVDVVVNWPQPGDEVEVRRFLGLASYYRKYIDKFADIAAPLHQLTQSQHYGVTDRCQQCRVGGSPGTRTASDWLCQSHTHQSRSQLQCDPTGVSSHCVGNETVNRHYLLGRTFQLMTDHAPLQWLAAQKMEGLLCRWALAIQEFSFEIVYRKGIANGNADALSRREPEMETPHAAMTTVYAGFTPEELKKAQKQDDTIQQLYTALNSQQTPLKNWKRTPMRRYAQLWSQLEVVDGIVCRRYKPGPTSDTIVVPVLPEALHQKAMSLCHDSPTAGHQGTLKTWERIRQEAYWVNMAQDVDRHCRECVTCQKAKLPMPVRSTLTNIPIGRPWQMIAIDIVEVPVSTKNNRHLLVISQNGQMPDPSKTRQQGYEATSYQAVLQAKMAELQDLMEAHVAESAHRQKVNYD
eukprot:Em0001g732a